MLAGLRGTRTTMVVCHGQSWSDYTHSVPAFVLAVLVCTIFCDTVLGLKCPPCDKIHCSPRRASRLQCKGGVTTCVCGCCPVCAKQEGEKCGGDYAYQGKCDRNLHCVPTSNTQTFISKVHTLKVEPIGVCKNISQKRSRGHQADASFAEFCRPKCSAEFCRKRPRAICSASEVVDTLVDCQGKCQHTSCRACTFIEKPECPACQQSDFRCLKKFGKCMQSFTCSNRKKSCMWTNKSKSQDKGKFVCSVPDCL